MINKQNLDLEYTLKLLLNKMVGFSNYRKFYQITEFSLYKLELQQNLKNLNLFLREYYFFKFFSFLIKHNISSRSLFNKTWFFIQDIWNIFCLTNNKKYFYYVLQLIQNNYFLPKFLYQSKIKHFLLFFSLSSSSLQNFNINQFKLNFLRIQKRYNKRRYSKARVYSRSSFFGGCALSSVFVGNFWNGTVKGVDWQTAIPYIIDMNSIIIGLLIYILIRNYQLFNLFFYIKSIHKLKIYTIKQSLILHNLNNFFK